MDAMLEHGFRHLPVIDARGPIGMVSIKDLGWIDSLDGTAHASAGLAARPESVPPQNPEKRRPMSDKAGRLRFACPPSTRASDP